VPGASDQPVLADGGPVFRDRPRPAANELPGSDRRPAAGAARSRAPHDDAAGGGATGAGAAGASAAGASAAGGGATGAGAAGEGVAGRHRSSTGVLADRMAATLVHHEPGWRLPRHTALARRYNVSTAQIDAAVAELAARHLIRRLPDGQLYRASPAEYAIPFEGASGLASHLDPMGTEIALRSRQVSWRRVPEDIGWMLGVAPGDLACVVRLLWTVDGEPAALATTYLARHVAGQPDDEGDVPAAALAALPLFTAPDPDGAAAQATGPRGAPAAGPGVAQAAGPGVAPAAGPGAAQGNGPGTTEAEDPRPAQADGPGANSTPRALFLEMQPPPPSVARSLRLSAGQPAAMVTVRFDDPDQGRPTALTVAVLRPDLFRIVVESPADGTEASFSGAWTHALQDWEP
jgi:hypothetical protein